MISVSDILKLLNEIPIWKAISALPKRVAELERKVAALEAASQTKPQDKTPSARICPLCAATMKVVSERAHPTFAFAGLKQHELECPECGNKATRDFDPGKGYK